MKSFKNTKKTQKLNDYKIGEVLGKGASGVVYRALNLINGHFVAIKSIPSHSFKPSNASKKDEFAEIEFEINLMKQLKHENIVRYFETIKTDSHLHIVIELVENGSLVSIMDKFGGSFSEQLAAHYVAQILEGLKYLHNEGVVHRDIKAANILSTKNGIMKLADFGVATKPGSEGKQTCATGSPFWMAPEVIEMSEDMTSACDIWSVGCTTVELLTGLPPYFHLSQMAAFFRVVEDQHPPLPPNISPQLKNFLLSCFRKNPLDRMTAAQLLKHKWILQNIDSIKRDSSLKSLCAKPRSPRASLLEKSHSSISISNSRVKLSQFLDSENDERIDFEGSLNSFSDERERSVSSLKESSSRVNEEISISISTAFKQFDFDEIEKEKGDIVQLKSWLESFGENMNDETQLRDTLEEIIDYLSVDDIRKQIVESGVLNRYLPRLVKTFRDSLEMSSVGQNILLFGELMARHCPDVFNKMILLGFLAVLGRVLLRATEIETKTIALNLIFSHILGPGEKENWKSFFLAGGGLDLFGCFFGKLFQSYFSLMRLAAECISSLLNTTKKKREIFCDVMADNGLIQKLAFFLSQCSENKEEKVISLTLSPLFLLFSTASELTKNVLCKKTAVKCICVLLIHSEDKVISDGLSCIKNLSKNPKLSKNAEKSGLLDILVRLLDHKDLKIQSASFKLIYDIIKIQPSLQEAAASLHLVPTLIRFINEENALKEMVYPIICKLAFAGPLAKRELKRFNALRIYTDMMEDNPWKSFAFDSFINLISHDCSNESILYDYNTVCQILQLTHSSDSKIWEKHLSSIYKLASVSSYFCEILISSQQFIDIIGKKLLLYESAASLTTFIKLVGKVLNSSINGEVPYDEEVVKRIKAILETLSESNKVLVGENANSLIKEIEKKGMLDK